MRSRPKGALRYSAILFVAMVWCGGCRLPFSSRPPEQASFGPGGSDYKHAAVGMTRIGEGAEEIWLFWPEEPTPAEAPLVVFLHGWSGVNPKPYSAWIAHLVRKGNIVAYPRYQEDIYTPFEEMEPSASASLRQAWKALIRDGPVQPKQDSVAWISHSLGGVLAVNLASDSAEIGLPNPGALMIVQPGGDERIAVTTNPVLPETTFALMVTADSDRWVGEEPARRIVNTFAGILPADQLSFVTVPSDWHSFPLLVADHFAPLSESAALNAVLDGVAKEGIGRVDYRDAAGAADFESPRPPDALDYYGYWKLADGLIDVTFRGVHGEFVRGDTAAERFMGVHSDGVPAEQLIVRELPSSAQ